MNGRALVDGYNAPLTAGNFVDLVQRGYYNNRVLKKSDTALLVDTRAGSKAAAAAADAGDDDAAGAGAGAGAGEEGASEAAATAAIEARWGHLFPFVHSCIRSFIRALSCARLKRRFYNGHNGHVRTHTRARSVGVYTVKSDNVCPTTARGGFETCE